MKGSNVTVRVVVAGEREATFLDLPGPKSQPREQGVLLNGAAGLKDQDLETDRPGRGFNRGNPGRHAMDGERSTERHETEQFARAVARLIEHGRVHHEFDRLVIMAGPRMLGLLREALSAPCRAVVAAEISKDLVRQDAGTIREAVPREVFFH